MKHDQISAGCVGKATYDSKGDALKNLRFRTHRNRAKQGRGGATPYRCNHCSGWHIGSTAFPERRR